VVELELVEGEELVDLVDFFVKAAQSAKEVQERQLFHDSTKPSHIGAVALRFPIFPKHYSFGKLLNLPCRASSSSASSPAVIFRLLGDLLVGSLPRFLKLLGKKLVHRVRNIVRIR
jgi:hypothetical protein